MVRIKKNQLLNWYKVALNAPENHNNKKQLRGTALLLFNINKKKILAFWGGRKRQQQQKATSAFLPVFCWQPRTCPRVWVRLHRHAAAGERKSTQAPGYSKLQIAADNIARYWNMFDLLTHTRRSQPIAPPPIFLSPLPPTPPPTPTPTPEAKHRALTVTCLENMNRKWPS